MVKRAVVEIVNDSSKLQTVQVTLLADEADDAVEHFQPYGLSARPPAGSEAIVLAVGGNTDHPVAVVVSDRRSRFKVGANGETAIYTDKGNRVHAKEDGSIAAVPELAGLVHLGADAAAQFVALAADVKARLDKIQADYDVHTHSHGAGPGTTGVPVPLIGALAPVAATKVKAT
jgi:phage baseplate assembly protein V